MDYTYEMFRNSINQLANDIDDASITGEGGDYDYIVGVTRGGLIPAVFLSHILGIPMLSINWSTRDSGIKSIGEDTTELLRDKKVLIVEDIIDSGKTLNELVDYLRDVCQFHVAALIYNTSQKIEPDYYDVIIDRTEYAHWINFFWEDKER